MKYGGITSNKISIMGVEIKFDNISVLYVFIWLIWVYFLIRYYQYFRQEGGSEISESLANMLTDICRPEIEKIIREAHPQAIERNHPFDYNSLSKVNWYTRRYSGEEKADKPPYYDETNPFEVDINLFSLWKQILKSYYHIIINRSVITDYILPLALAVFAFIYCNFFGNWTGSVFNIW
jgi:hypothetical protein